MCSSSGFFPAPERVGFSPADACPVFSPFPRAPPALSCLPLLPSSTDGTELNPKTLSECHSQTKRGAKLSLEQQSERREEEKIKK